LVVKGMLRFMVLIILIHLLLQQGWIPSDCYLLLLLIRTGKYTS
jgi:hypothetical protein